jgi:YD repeat-containing protein
MKRTSLIATCLFLLLGFSCTKSNDDLSGKKLSRILVTNGVIAEYTYNSDGLLAKTVSYAPPGVVSNEQKMYYDNARKLTKVESAINISSSTGSPQMDLFYSDYTYETGRVKETKNYRLISGTYVHISTSQYEYDANGRVSAITIVVPTGQLNFKNTYQYDANGNIAVNEVFQYPFGAAMLSLRTAYEYDNQKNPFAAAAVMPFIANKNNVTKETLTSFSTVPGVPPTSTLVTTYKQYSSDGYPLLTSYGGVDQTYEYK